MSRRSAYWLNVRTDTEAPQPSHSAAEAGDRAAKAKQLGAIRRRSFALTAALSLVYPASLWLSGAFERGWAALLALGLPPWWATAVALAIYGLGEALVLLPTSHHSGFVVAHRFGLSRQGLRDWLADWAKGLLIGLLLSMAAGMLFFWALLFLGSAWWWAYGLALTAGFAFLSFLAPYVLVPLFFRMRAVEDAQLVERLRALFARAGVTLHDVCSLDFSRRTVEANAAVIGLGASRRIVLADTLLQSFSPREVDSVVAHELGHHVHRDVPRLIALQCAATLLGLALAHWLALPALRLIVAIDVSTLPAALPLLAGAAQLYMLLVMPLTNAISRIVERGADGFALRLTGDPDGFIAAMRKLADQNLAEEQPPRWAEMLLYTHPSIARRVAMARSWEPRGGSVLGG